MAIVYFPAPQQPKDCWIRYLNYRIQKKNQNNLITIVGSTGSGKTYFGVGMGRKLSKKNGTHFGIENIVFSLQELMNLINSGKLKKGSVILFDEPQISISSREFQSKANKIFNYLLSTFRHLNYTLIFCTPYEDLLDKSTRKLFHGKIVMQSIDVKNEVSRAKPYIVEYNSKLGKFYEKFLRVCYKPSTKACYVTQPLKIWTMEKPPEELINQYEKKKRVFTTALNKDIQEQLEDYQNKKDKKKEEPKRKPLTERQNQVMDVFANIKENNKYEIASKKLGLTYATICRHKQLAEKKGYTLDEFKKK